MLGGVRLYSVLVAIIIQQSIQMLILIVLLFAKTSIKLSIRKIQNHVPVWNFFSNRRPNLEPSVRWMMKTWSCQSSMPKIHSKTTEYDGMPCALEGSNQVVLVERVDESSTSNPEEMPLIQRENHLYAIMWQVHSKTAKMADKEAIVILSKQYVVTLIPANTYFCLWYYYSQQVLVCSHSIYSLQLRVAIEIGADWWNSLDNQGKEADWSRLS